MAYELTGKVKVIQEQQTFESGFTKREMVVTVEDGKYPQDISLEFIQEKVALLDNISEGEEVTVSFDIRGREYNGRYFNNLQGWKVVTASQDNSAPNFTESSPPPNMSAPENFDDDIPF